MDRWVTLESLRFSNSTSFPLLSSSTAVPSLCFPSAPLYVLPFTRPSQSFCRHVDIYQRSLKFTAQDKRSAGDCSTRHFIAFIFHARAVAPWRLAINPQVFHRLCTPGACHQRWTNICANVRNVKNRKQTLLHVLLPWVPARMRSIVYNTPRLCR